MYWDGYGRVKRIQFSDWFLLTKWRKYHLLYSKKYSPKIHWDDLTSVNSHSFIATDKGCYLKQRRVPLRHAQSRLCDGESAGLVAGPSLQLNGTQPSLTFFFIIYKKWSMINERIVPHAPLQQSWRWRRRQPRTYVLHNTSENDVHHCTCSAVLRYLFSRCM